MARRFAVRPKSVGLIVVVALGTVVAYDWYKHNTKGPVAGARPGTIAP
jgi:hypothetical protein